MKWNNLDIVTIMHSKYWTHEMGEGMISEITTHISVIWEDQLFCCCINLSNSVHKILFLYIPHPESAVFTLHFYRNRWWMHKRREPKTRSNQGTMSCILTAAKKKGDIKKKKKRRGYISIKRTIYSARLKNRMLYNDTLFPAQALDR